MAAEQLALFYYRTRQVPAVVARMTSTYGPHLKKPRLIAAAIEACAEKSNLKLTSGRQKRDFLYIGDAVDGLLRAATEPKARGEIINLGSPQSYMVREAVETVCRVSGQMPQIEWGTVADRANENVNWRTNVGKARKILGWSPKFPLEKGLAEMWKWHVGKARA